MALASGCDGDRCRLYSARRSTARREGRRTAAGAIQGVQGTLLTRGLSGIYLGPQPPSAMIAHAELEVEGMGARPNCIKCTG